MQNLPINNLRLKNDHLFGVIILVQYIIYFIYLFKKEQILIFLYLVFGLVNILLYILIIGKLNSKSLCIFTLISTVIVIFGIFSPQYNAFIDIYVYLFGVVTFFSAYQLYLLKNIRFFILSFFWFMTAVIFYTFYKNGITDPNVYNFIFDDSSRNYVSMIYIFILVMLHLVYNKEGKHLSLMYSLITFIGAIILFGRTGIIISTLILLYSLINSNISKFFKWLICFIIIVSLFSSITILEAFLMEKTSFSQGIESPRSLMLEEYFATMTENLLTLLFGLELEYCCPTIVGHKYNTHNSFIMGHVRFGVFHLFLSIIIYIYVLSSKNFLLIFFISIIYFRYWFDQIGLFSPVDIVLFYILVSSFFLKKKRLMIKLRG